MKARQLEMIVRDIETRMDANPVRDPAPNRIQRQVVVGATALALLTLFACTRRASPDSLGGTDVPGSLETGAPVLPSSLLRDSTRIRVARCPEPQDPVQLAEFNKEVEKTVPILRDCMDQNPGVLKKGCLLRLTICIKDIWKKFSGPTCEDRVATQNSPLVDSTYFMAGLIRKVIPNGVVACHGNLTNKEAKDIIADAVEIYPLVLPDA